MRDLDERKIENKDMIRQEIKKLSTKPILDSSATDAILNLDDAANTDDLALDNNTNQLLNVHGDDVIGLSGNSITAQDEDLEIVLNWDQERDWSTRLRDGYVGDFIFYLNKLNTYISEARTSDDVTQHVLSVSVDKATLVVEQRMAHDIYVSHCVDSAYVGGCVLMWGMGGVWKVPRHPCN